MAKASFEVNVNSFKEKALHWAQQFNDVCFLQSNGYQDKYSKVSSLLAVDALHTFQAEESDAFENLEIFQAKHPNNWMFGFFSYDLKNEIEDVQTELPNTIEFPDIFFFIPKTVIHFYDKSVQIEADNPKSILESIIETKIPIPSLKSSKIKLKHRLNKDNYISAFQKLMNHIHRGDLYEVNLCQEFYATGVKKNPVELYTRLNSVSPSPFSAFLKLDDKFIISASPERFLTKRNEYLISQPIKGTAPRGKSPAEDIEIINQLRNNPKEIAENMMVVDLVRNDMTQAALPGTVVTEQKLKVHTFKQVHQLISTITCVLNPKISNVQAIKNTFPPGSMTGAPKISAMNLCDQYENSRRGVYSGALGYFSPDDDFDFSVVIRTILYNKTKEYLSFHTGGAITIDAEAEKEYQECLLKASGILKALNIE